MTSPDKITTIPHLIQLEGGRNLRDLGGYKGAGGASIKKGLLFRAAELNSLTEGDLQLLADLGLKTVVDFRRIKEAQAAPDRLPPTVRRAEAIPIDPVAPAVAALGRAGLNIPLQAQTSASSPDEPLPIDPAALSRLFKSTAIGDSFMMEINRAMVTDFQSELARFLEITTAPENTPLLFHCSADKDRTGLAAALILLALGVDKSTVMDDYLFSNRGLGDKYSRLLAEHPLMEPLVTVKAGFIGAGLDVIEEQYGGIDNYLRNKLKADPDRLREIYLEF